MVPAWAIIVMLLFVVVCIVVLYEYLKDDVPAPRETDPASAAREAMLIEKAQQRTELPDSCQIDEADDFTPQLRSPVKPGTIFVSIASYRDDECKDTVYQMYEQAARPDRIFTGVVQQNKEGEEDCFDKCEKCKARKDSGHIRVTSFPHTEAKGPTFARFECSKLWDGEEYYLQIDSHSKFEKGWDETAIAQMEATRDPKGIIGGYPPTDAQMKTFKGNDFSQMITMCTGVMNSSRIPEIRARIVKTPSGSKPVPMMYSGAGMLMMPYQALLDVPYDPYLSYIFFGEEILHSARLWTHGYNFYAPRKAFMTHHYTRKGKPKFWEDKGMGFKSCQKKAVHRARFLLGQEALDRVPEDFRKDVQKYGMGSVRPLSEYFKKAGIDWEKNEFKSTCKEMGTPN